MWARGEIPNNMQVNGEMLLQNSAVKAWQSSVDGNGKFIAFDVGANVGEWSMALIKLAKHEGLEGDISIYAFEPVPSTFEILKSALSEVALARLSVEKIALSSCAGEKELYVSQERGAGTNTMHEWRKNKHGSVFVQTMTLDEYCSRHGISYINFAKVDTEGHDLEVIRGAMNMLGNAKISILQFEYNQTWIYSRNFLRDVFLLIEDLPYSLIKLQSNCLFLFYDYHFEMDKFFDGNYAIVRNDIVGRLPLQRMTYNRHNSLESP